MKKLILTALLVNLFVVNRSLAQALNVDTAFIRPYSQKILLEGYVSTNALEIVTADKKYMPNNPLNVGAGIAVKNTVINVMFDYGLIPLKSNSYGKTKLTDLQIHNYRKYLVLDLFFQRYKGFYDPLSGGQRIISYPDLSVSQIGAEGTYVFNGNKFSARAAFEQSEQQLKSAGSFLLGGGVYSQKIGLDSMMSVKGKSPINNFQAGLNLGYGYSWVINDRWQLSGIAKIGANSTNEPQLVGNSKFKIYPTAFAKGAAAYQKPVWAVVFQMLINNKAVYGYQNKFQVTSVNFQLAYVRHLNGIFQKKKKL